MIQPSLSILPTTIAAPEDVVVSRPLQNAQSADFRDFFDIQAPTEAVLPMEMTPSPATVEQPTASLAHPASAGKTLPPELPLDPHFAVQQPDGRGKPAEPAPPVSEPIKNETADNRQPDDQGIPVMDVIVLHPVVLQFPHDSFVAGPSVPRSSAAEAAAPQPHTPRLAPTPLIALPTRPVEARLPTLRPDTANSANGTAAEAPGVTSRPAMTVRPQSADGVQVEVPFSVRKPSAAPSQEMHRALLPNDLIQTASEQSVLPALNRLNVQHSVPIHAAMATSAAAPPHDFSALIDRIASARESSSIQTVSVMLAHNDFGPIRLNFRTEEAALSISMTSPDPDFARAAAANPVSVVPVQQSDQTAAGQPRSDGSPVQSQSQPQSHSGSAGQQRRDDQPPRQQSTPDSGRPHNQPRSRNGIFA